MSKHSTETLLEIFIEENEKLKKLVLRQNELNKNLEKIISSASSFEIKSDRLEEVIKYWNELFNKQKAQILELQKSDIKGSREEDSKVFKILVLMTILLLINLIYSLWN
jgi:hypothetical protein